MYPKRGDMVLVRKPELHANLESAYEYVIHDIR